MQVWQAAVLRHPQDTALRDLLASAAQQQAALCHLTLELAFRQRNEQGECMRQAPADFADTLSLPIERCERLLRSAIKATPLPADEEAVDVLYEDDFLIAVNKPPGVRSAPIHRHLGGSMVNRLIAHLGDTMPRGLHRLDMDTSGVLLFAKRQDVVPQMHAQFRRRTVQKRYVAIALGVPRLPAHIGVRTSSAAL